VNALEGLIRGAKDNPGDLAVYKTRMAVLDALRKEPKDKHLREATELLKAHPKEPFPGCDWNGAGRFLCGSTPASDGERVLAVFHPGLMVCYDLAGNLLWRRVVVNEAGQLNKVSWGEHAEAPTFVDGKVLLSWGEWTQLFEASTGELIWAKDKTGASCASSALVGKGGESWYFARLSGGVFRLSDGENILNSPIPRKGHHTLAVSEDRSTFYFCVSAVRLPETPDQKPTVLWQVADEYWHYTPDHVRKKPSERKRENFITPGGHSFNAPAVHGGVVYSHQTGRGGGLAKIDAETGEVLSGPVYRRDFAKYGHGGGNYPSQIVAGDCLFQPLSSGRISVIRAGRDVKQEVVAQNMLEHMEDQHLIFQGRRMYVRTEFALFCIGADKPQPKVVISGAGILSVSNICADRANVGDR